MKTSILNKLTIVLFTFFVFSGLIKWLKIWPIDATVLFGSLTLLSLAIVMLLKKRVFLYRIEINFIVSLLMFSIWYYISMIYSSSTTYIFVKAINYILVLIAFIVPFLTIFSIKDVKFYLLSFSSAGLIVAGVIFYLYIIGNSDLYLTYFKLLEYGNPLGLPDYLALGSPIGLSVIISIFYKNGFYKTLGLFSVLTLILLSGRGPLLAVIVVSLIIIIIQFRFNKKMLRNVALALTIFSFSSSYLYNWKGMERLSSRVERIDKGDKSLEERYELLYFSKDLFLEKPILGIGLGSFGIVYNGIDQRFYPHNLLVEIIVEQGLIGFILFMLFFSSFILFVCRKMLFANEPMFYTLVGLFIYELINALKSSSIIEHRLLFSLMGICIVSYKFLKPLKSSQIS